MDSREASQDRFLLAICPQCHEPLYPSREQEGQDIPCPECGSPVPVPKAPHPQPPAESASREYGIHDSEYVPKAVEYIKLSCPTCNTLLYAEPERVGTKMT